MQDSLISSVKGLARRFRDAGRLVIWVRATGLPQGRVAQPIPEPETLPEDFSDLVEAAEASPADNHVFKQRTVGAFSSTNIAEILRTHEVSDVVLAGLATCAGVDTTARGAFDAGFTVHVLGGDVWNSNAGRHEATLTHDVPGYRFVTSCASILELFQSGTNWPEFSWSTERYTHTVEP